MENQTENQTEQQTEFRFDGAEQVPTDPMTDPSADPTDTEPKPEPPVGEAVKAMVFGILSTMFSYAPLFSIVAIVFATLARRWSLPIIVDYPYTGARLFAKAGRITGTVGLILSIIFTAFWGLALIPALVGSVLAGL